jgi:ABC-2 type transport system permease protein
MRLRAVARKEIRQLRRDPRSMAMAFLLPGLLVVFFGYAITWDVDSIATGICDQDGTSRSRELADAFRAAHYFDLVEWLPSPAAVGPLLDRRRIQVALVIPPGFAADLDAGRAAPLQAIVDGSDANTATIILGYVEAITTEFATDIVLNGVQRRPPIVTQSRVWYNEDLKSRNMIVPGLVAVIMAIIAAMLTSLTIAREWERGTMEQLASTPVSRFEVVAGKLIPYLGIGLIDVVVSTVLGILVYGVPFRGDPLLLLALSFLFLVGALGLGIFVSAVARTQLLATQMAMLLTFLPSYLLSGFMFSVSVMPAPLRLLSTVIPARYFLVVTRGIFLKGVGLRVLWPDALLMLAFAGIGLGLAVRTFRKELR